MEYNRMNLCPTVRTNPMKNETEVQALTDLLAKVETGTAYRLDDER